MENMVKNPLDQFFAPVAAWFRDVFHEPTVVQQQAWQAISSGDNALVVAPTGSGKTLAAFLWSLSQLTGAGVLSHPSSGSSSDANPHRRHRRSHGISRPSNTRQWGCQVTVNIHPQCFEQGKI